MICFKSELHLAQDGPKLPIQNLWQQLIAEAAPKLVITTGTAGGIGAEIIVGDVIVSPAVQFDCTAHLQEQPVSRLQIPVLVAQDDFVRSSRQPLQSQRSRICRPRTGRRESSPRRRVPSPMPMFSPPISSLMTTPTTPSSSRATARPSRWAMPFWAWSSRAWAKVLRIGSPSATHRTRRWMSTGLTPEQVRNKAGQIYEKFGYWSTIPSAITTWALIVDN